MQHQAAQIGWNNLTAVFGEHVLTTMEASIAS
jgi:hypothetical protein